MGRKPVAKKRVQNPQKKREFLKKLTPTILENGIRKLSMDELASLAGVTKATLYKYFRSRDEIIAEAVSCKLENIQAFEDILGNKNTPFIQRYLGAIRIFIENIKGISTQFLLDLKDMYPSIWNEVQQFRQYANSVISDYYQEGIEKGVFKDIHPTILIMSDQLFFSKLLDPEFLHRHHLTIQQAFRDYFKLKLEGAIHKSSLREDASEEVEKMINQLFHEEVEDC